MQSAQDKYGSSRKTSSAFMGALWEVKKWPMGNIVTTDEAMFNFAAVMAEDVFTTSENLILFPHFSQITINTGSNMFHCTIVLNQHYILGQKRNAAYITYIVYGGSFTNLSQKICHSLSANSWIMSSWGCASYHCQRTTLIQQFKPTFLSILTSRH